MKKIIICLIFFVVCLSLSMAEMKKDSKTILQNIQRITFQDNTVQTTAASGSSNTELYADKVVSTSTMYSLGTFEAVGAAGFTRIFSTGTVSVTGRIEALGISGAISAVASSGFQLGTNSVIDASGVNMRVGRGYTNTEIHSTGFYTPWGGSRASISTWTASGLEVSGYGKFSGITHIAGTATFEDDIEMSGTNKRIDGNGSANIVNMNSISLKAGQGNFYTRSGTADGLRDKGVGDFVFRNGNKNVMRFKHCVSSCVAIYLWDNDSATPSAPVIISSETPGRFFYCDPSYADWTMHISSLVVKSITFMNDGTVQNSSPTAGGGGGNKNREFNLDASQFVAYSGGNGDIETISRENTFLGILSTSTRIYELLEYNEISWVDSQFTWFNQWDNTDITVKSVTQSSGTVEGDAHTFIAISTDVAFATYEIYESTHGIYANAWQTVITTYTITSTSDVMADGKAVYYRHGRTDSGTCQQNLYYLNHKFEYLVD